MNTPGKLTNIIFDMDGCLIDSEQAYIRAWAYAFERKKIPIEMSEIISWAGEGKLVINDKVTAITGSRELAMELRQIREDYFYVLLDQGEVMIKPYAYEILDFIKSQGLGIAIASSTFSDRGERMLEKFQLKKWISTVTWGDEVAVAKPDPEVYLKTLDKLKAQKEDCLVFEDSYNGVVAAVRAGLTVVNVPDTSVRQTREIPPVYAVIPDFREGIEIIRRRLSCGD